MVRVRVNIRKTFLKGTAFWYVNATLQFIFIFLNKHTTILFIKLFVFFVLFFTVEMQRRSIKEYHLMHQECVGFAAKKTQMTRGCTKLGPLLSIAQYMI